VSFVVSGVQPKRAAPVMLDATDNAAIAESEYHAVVAYLQQLQACW